MSLRLRIVLAVGALTLVVVLAAGIAFDAYLGSATRATLQRSLKTRESRVRAAFRAGLLPLAPPGGVAKPAADQSLVQVVDAQGRVLYTTGTAGTLPLIAGGELRAAQHQPLLYTIEHHRGYRNPVMVRAEPLGVRNGAVLLVGGSTDQIVDSLALARMFLFGGGIVAVLLAAAGAGLLAGVVLRPVEAMRRQADELSGGLPGEGLADPGTGDELALLAMTLNDLLARIHDSAELQRRFIAAASHELRTPLAGMRAELETRRSHTGELEAELLFQRLERRVEQLVKLTGGLLEIAQGQSSTLLLDLRSCALEPVVSAALAASFAHGGSGGPLLVVDADPGVSAVVDPIRLGEVVDNLVANAVRFSPPGEPVEVALCSREGLAFLEVRDRGPGFLPDLLPRAFEPFVRAGLGGGSQEGFGLGLALVRLIARAHGGDAVVENRPGGGAVARVWFPVAGPALVPVVESPGHGAWAGR